ncbi:MAG: hypothetical protein RSD49_16335 [Hafnia sp.]
MSEQQSLSHVLIEACYLVAIWDINALGDRYLMGLNSSDSIGIREGWLNCEIDIGRYLYRGHHKIYESLQSIATTLVNNYPEADWPELLDDSDVFQKIYHDALFLSYHQAEQEETWQRNEADEAEKKRILQLIEQNCWGQLSLPTPESLTELLLTVASTRVDLYFLIYEEDCLWFTNPYGCDGVLGSKPTVRLMRSFLKNVALGYEYGPVPH